MRVLAIAMMTGCLGAAAAGATERLEIAAESVFSFYRSLHLVTPMPIEVSDRLATACTSRLGPDAATGWAGPHRGAAIKLWVNDLAMPAFGASPGPLPEGAVIVKEKLKSGEVTAVGGMVKRAPGFDPSHGDWEYFYAERSAGFATGRLGTCIACHDQAKANDYVFRLRAESLAPASTGGDAR
jgi:hypothetical protein